MEQAISMQLPIIVVNLNQKTNYDFDRFPNVLKNYPTISISFHSKIMQYALEKWESSFNKHYKNKEFTSFSYKQSVYDNLGI